MTPQIYSNYNNRKKGCLFNYKKQGNTCVAGGNKSNCNYSYSRLSRYSFWQYVNWIPYLRKRICPGVQPHYTIVIDLGESWYPDNQWRDGKGIGYRKIWWAVGQFLSNKPAWTEATVYTKDTGNREMKFNAIKWGSGKPFLLQCMQNRCGGYGFKQYAYVTRWGNGGGRGRQAKITAVANSQDWGNTCQGMSNKLKTYSGRTWGNANPAAQKWWIHNKCNTKPVVKKPPVKKCPPSKKCPPQYGLTGYKNQALKLAKDSVSKASELFNTLSNQYTDRTGTIDTQNELLNKQNTLINLRNNTIAKHNNTINETDDKIHMNRRKLMYNAPYDRRSIIFTRILKLILLILGITSIVLLSIKIKNK